MKLGSMTGVDFLASHEEGRVNLMEGDSNDSVDNTDRKCNNARFSSDN